MKKHQVNFTLNGEPCTVEIAPNRTLLSVLREDLNLTGSKCGCGVGECGACTVLMNGMAVNSCLILAPQIENSNIVTIEGLSSEKILDPLQSAFMETGAVQCGYCTAGMIMSIKGLLNKTPDPSDEQIRETISGNLCRCTGYEQIVEAVHKSLKYSAV